MNLRAESQTFLPAESLAVAAIVVSAIAAIRATGSGTTEKWIYAWLSVVTVAFGLLALMPWFCLDGGRRLCSSAVGFSAPTSWPLLVLGLCASSVGITRVIALSLAYRSERSQ